MLLFAACVLALAADVHSQTRTPADLILHNGKIVTVDDSFSIAEAIRPRGSAAPFRCAAGSGLLLQADDFLRLSVECLILANDAGGRPGDGVQPF